MFSFFRKKAGKSQQDGGTAKKNDAKIFDSARQIPQNGDGYINRGKEKFTETTETCGDSKTTCVLGETNEIKLRNKAANRPYGFGLSSTPESDSIHQNHIKCDTKRTSVDVNCNGQYDDTSRRNSKTSKEVVNLLLPEDSVKYKRDTSYLSKAGVQSLLDKMGRNRKRPKNEKKNRSWTFGRKCDETEHADAPNRRSTIDSNSNVFINISDDAVNNMSMDEKNRTESEDSLQNLIAEMNGINLKLNEKATDNVSGDGTTVNHENTISKTEYAGISRSPRMSMIDNDLRSGGRIPPVGVDVITPVAEADDKRPVGDIEESGSDRHGIMTSTRGNNAKHGTGGGGRWYFGTDEDQSAEKRDTTRSTNEFRTFDIRAPEDRRPADDPLRCQEVAEAEGSVEYKPGNSLLDSIEFELSAKKDDNNRPVDEIFVLELAEEVENQMGATDSKQNGKNKVSKSSVYSNGGMQPLYSDVDRESFIECKEFSEHKLESTDEFHDVLSTVEEADVIQGFIRVGGDYSDNLCENTTNFKESPNMNDTSVVNGLLSLEITKLAESKEISNVPTNEIDKNLVGNSLSVPIETKLRHILKEENSFEKPSSFKKHVTFQNFIEFDDGDKDDVVDDDSYASIDDTEEDSSVFQLDVDNVENPDNEVQSGIVEFEDSSTSEDISIVEKCKKEKEKTAPITNDSAVVIKELEVENDECIGFEEIDYDEPTRPSRVEVFEEKREHIIKIEVEDALEIKLIEEEASEVRNVLEESSEEEVSVEESVSPKDDTSEEEEEEDDSLEESVVGSEEESEDTKNEIKDVLFETKNETKEIGNKEVKAEVGVNDEEDEEVEAEEEEDEVEEEEEYEGDDTSEDVPQCEIHIEESIDREKSLNNSEIIKADTNIADKLVETWLSFKYGEAEEDCAYSELLKVLEKQMRGLVGQDERLADLQERAAALHRVQNEVCSARKEAELVRQKLWHVEADLAATRCRNSQLLEQLEARTEDAKAAESKIKELTEKAARLQELLDKLIPENEQLKEKYKILKAERDEERKIIEETLSQADQEREAREAWWKNEFEKLRSQGAEREELLLADCEWKLREVQQAAREKGAMAEQRLKDLQRQADERCAHADTQLAQMSELKALQTEVATLRQSSREQARALRLAGERASHAAQAETEASRLRALLDREKAAFGAAKSEYTRELEEKENRLIERLQEQASRLERELKQKYETEEQERRVREQQESCRVHESIIKDAYDRLEMLKATLTKKETQYEENLLKEKSRADWELLELRRVIDKTEIKHAEALEKLEDMHAKETERINEEMEKKVKELETALSSQAVSARSALELVKVQLKSDHAETLQRLKEKHKTDMEKQWDIFVADKEECLERMKAECILEGQEDREKRDKDLLKDIEVLKSELSTQEHDLSVLKVEARKATESKIIAERKLSDLQVAYEQREMAVRSEVSRQAEVAQREARETIEHLTKKCACLSNLFEDMRSRWQQAPGEAAQLRKALQDEKAKSAALRRQLDALSRYRQEDERRRKEDMRNQPNINGVQKQSLGSQYDETKLPGELGESKNEKKEGIVGVDDPINSEDLGDVGFTEVKPPRRKGKKKRSKSPPKSVYLPPVTLPVRIKQFDANKTKK